ncbi:adenosylhomocysteinase [bacterium]|nr:adenosylhomocysteinase [bacterium]
MPHDVKSMTLAKEGQTRIEWARQFMPVVQSVEERFRRQKPLKGVRIAACLHVTTETANLARALKAGGADVRLCASNPLSTQDDVAAALVKVYGISVFAVRGEDRKSYYSHIRSALGHRPQITMDDGADLVSELHKDKNGASARILGGTEETTTGVIRLRSMADKGVLRFPVISVNDADTKHLFDNRYGTGQSTLDGIIRATNTLLAGQTVVVCGYGWCGRGVAERARGMGAHVTVIEVDPLRALQAVMDGFRVEPLARAAAVGDIFVTLTGDISVLRKEHFLKMKDGAIVANSGHFNVEIDIPDLRKLSRSVRTLRTNVQEYALKNGRRIMLLAEGRLVNLAAAEGHPAMVMDMSFANQALAAEYLSKNGRKLKCQVYPVPRQIDEYISRLKLKTMGVNIDRLTEKQRQYLASWEMGT